MTESWEPHTEADLQPALEQQLFIESHIFDVKQQPPPPAKNRDIAIDLADFTVNGKILFGVKQPSTNRPSALGAPKVALRLVQLVISTAAAYVAFEAVDTLNLPLLIGATAVTLGSGVAVAVILAAQRRERRNAGLPRAASATVGVAFAFALLQLVGTVGAGAVVWSNDTCTMQMGTQKANLTLTGFFSRQVCQNVEGSTENKLADILGDADRVLRHIPGVVGVVAGALGTPEFHDGSRRGPIICTGWLREARWVVATVRDQGIFDIYGKAMCGSLNAEGLLTYPFDH